MADSPCSGRAEPFAFAVDVGRPCLSGCSDALWSGDKMAIGVSRRSGAAARSWSAVQRRWQQQGCWELAAVHRLVGRETLLRRAIGSGGGCEDLVAEAAQGVVAAAGELAGHGQQRQLAIQPCLDLPEVGVIG